MRARIEQELALLREQHPDVEHAELNGEDWFRLPRYSIPEGWQEGKTPVSTTDMVFQVKANYPGTKPYGFLAPVDLNFKGNPPVNNVGDPPANPPFEGSWRHFSWDVEEWTAKADVRKGSNLLVWCRSFRIRLQEGV
jgi:hypothetical protein